MQKNGVRERKKTNFNFKIDGVSLDIVKKHKYLGNIFNEHLDFKVISTILTGAAGRALGSVISKFKALKNTAYNTCFKMYHSYVVPIMDYGSGVWGYDNSEAGDKVQFRAIRYYLGIHPKTPLLALEGDMGWNSCKIRQCINMIRLWNRLINMDENKLTKRVLKWDYIICKNWCFEVKEIFFLFNFRGYMKTSMNVV